MTNDVVEMKSNLEVQLESYLTFDKFENWLHDHQPEDIVGKVNSCDECPISNYMNEMVHNFFDFPEAICVVGSQDITILAPGYKRIIDIEMPEWSQSFIYSVDSWAEGQIDIPAEVCQDVLEGIR